MIRKQSEMVQMLEGVNLEDYDADVEQTASVLEKLDPG